MLPRLPLRFVLADDPRAGKTIMTGLFIKELIAYTVNYDLSDLETKLYSAVTYYVQEEFILASDEFCRFKIVPPVRLDNSWIIQPTHSFAKTVLSHSCVC